MNIDSIVFRKPTMNDGVAVYDLVQRCAPLDRNSIYCNLLQCVDFADTAIIAEVNNQVVGFVSGYRPPERANTLFVWQVAVASEMRGKGLAQQMLRRLLSRCAALGVVALETTITPTNTASQKLFERLFQNLDAQVSSRVLFSSNDHFKGRCPDEVLYRAEFPPSALSGL